MTMNSKDIGKHFDGKLALLILDRYDGSDAYEPMSAHEIAKKTGYNKGRVSQIEMQAIEKLKQNPDAWELMIQLSSLRGMIN